VTDTKFWPTVPAVRCRMGTVIAMTIPAKYNGNMAKQKKPAKKPTQSSTEFSDNLGKLLLDLSKLTFASFILGGILKGDLPSDTLIIAGSIVFVVFAAAGLILTSRKKNRG